MSEGWCLLLMGKGGAWRWRKCRACDRGCEAVGLVLSVVWCRGLLSCASLVRWEAACDDDMQRNQLNKLTGKPCCARFAKKVVFYRLGCFFHDGLAKCAPMKYKATAWKFCVVFSRSGLGHKPEFKRWLFVQLARLFAPSVKKFGPPRLVNC